MKRERRGQRVDILAETKQQALKDIGTKKGLFKLQYLMTVQRCHY